MKPKTIIIGIGNSDDKLSQQEWSNYIDCVNLQLKDWKIYFSGGSCITSAYQNYCWVIMSDDYDKLSDLQFNLKCIRKQFKQDSIALTVGETILI